MGAVYSGINNINLVTGEPVGDWYQRGTVISGGVASTAGIAAGGLGLYNWATAAPASVPPVISTTEATAPQYYIADGVRRSVSSLQAGATEIPGTIYVEGQAPVTTTVPLNQLFSPKPEIPLDIRFLNIQPPINTPINLQPLGLPGQLPTVPLNQVRIVPPGGG